MDVVDDGETVQINTLLRMEKVAIRSNLNIF